MWFAIIAALVTGGVVWAATRKPSSGPTVAAAPAERPERLDAESIADLHRELEGGFLKKASVKFTALGNVFVDQAAGTITIDLTAQPLADARKILSVLPPGTFGKGYRIAYLLPQGAPAVRLGGELEIAGVNDDLDDVGGGDWGQS